MDSEALVLSAPNSKSLLYSSSERSLTRATSKAMAYEPTQKTSPPILERFRAMLKQRDDELRALAGNDVSPPLSEEIVQLYDLLLSELSFNSKPVITDLTIIAGDQRQYGKGIADVICARILEVPADQKLPSLYLLDSIVKNIGREYIRYFSSCLPEVFCEAYRKIHPNQRNAMRHLFGTWSTVFPPSVLHKIEDQLQFSPISNQQSSGLTPLRTSESPRPSHGIHVNPKYLHQMERGATDSAKGIANVKGYGEKHVSETARYNTDRGESSQSNVGSEMFGVNKLNSSSNFRRAKISSPSRLVTDRLQPSIAEELKANHSHSLLVERTSPSRRVFDYGSGRRFGRDEETKRQQKKTHPDDYQNQAEPVVGRRVINGREHEEARALIDAYGSDGGNNPFNDSSLRVERLETNGLRPISWQNTEEEEFDWEDMSPTLANSGRNNDLDSKAVQTLGFRTGLGLDGLSSRLVKTNANISWSSHGQLPAASGYSIITDDAVSSASPWDVHNHVSHPSQYHMKSKGSGRNFHTAEKISQMSGKLSTGNALHRQPAMLSRIVSSSVENSDDEVQLAIQPKKLDILGRQDPNLTMLPQHGEPIHMHHGNNVQSNAYKPMFRSPLEARDNIQSSAGAPLLPHLMAPSLSQGLFSQVPSHPIISGPSISASVVQNLPINNIPSNHLQLLRRPLPPLPHGPPPGSMHLMPVSSTGGQISSGQHSGNGLSSLMNSLMSQGVISLTNQNSVQDSLGLDFNMDVLKLHNKSAISALYTDLPRQCTTCGLRFKTQDEHSSHMDWHVTKNRMSKSRKQNPSRKWFVNVNMWLSGAEALGTEAVPGFLPAETVVEKDSDELAVPADEDQNACALCGEPFDDFYSDEFEEWMYKGAVYMNAPDGLIAGMDKTQLGPIVHAKCRSDSSSAPQEYLGQDDGGSSGEGNKRKRLRT